MAKAGTYNKMVNGKMRRVRILANGQWRFLKGSAKSGGKKKTGGTRTMAKGKKNGNGRQGIVSWLSTAVQLGMTFANPVVRVMEAAKQDTGKGSYFVRRMIQDYTGALIDVNWTYLRWDPKFMIRGYAGPVGGYVQKKATSYFMKGVKFQLIPKLRA